MQDDLIGVIVNRKSGRNAREAAALDKAMAIFGDRARLEKWDTKTDPRVLVDRLVAEGRRTIVAAGGDGTVTAIASALEGRQDARLAVLPLGTFNYFARGLGLPEDPEDAARAILTGHEHRIAVGKVNGQLFLNNASVGIYPHILKERETVYGRWGRYRLAAHWSVIKTFLRFQRPMHLQLTADGVMRDVRTPLVFVARSAYQLARYGLEGAEAISADRFAMFLANGTETRGGLFRLTWRLVTRSVRHGVDVDLVTAREIEVDSASRRALVAFDGEKTAMRLPLRFSIAPDALAIVLPAATEDDKAPRAA